MRRLVWGIVAILLFIPAGAGAAKRQKIESHWRDREIAIDGDSGDWPGPLLAIEKKPINAAVANDDRSLYLVLSTSDAAARRQIMRQGLLVWFDPGGGDKKHFGIKFPVGRTSDTSGADRRRGRGGFGRPRGGGGESDPGASPGTTPDQPDQIEPPDRLEVYGPAKDDAHNFVVEAAPGIAVKVGQVEGYLVYELKVPLAKTSETPFAIETKPGTLIGLGLETPKFERPQRGGGFGGPRGGPGGGMGGPGGGMGGRGGMSRRRGGGFEEVKPLNAWATVQLAGH